ncbi:MAG: sugar transferase [Acidobacteriota bacterium]
MKGLPRVVEATAAALALWFAAPVLVVIAVLIKASSPGPVLFRQERVGRHGRPFTLLKFRSMRTGHRGLLVTAAGDGRITPIGALLRTTKLDELPTLWHVVRGEMSLVGPRPEVPRYVDLDNPLWREVLAARPGITDPVTLRLRNEEELLATVEDDRDTWYRDVLAPWKLRGYADYQRRRSALTDLVVLVDTLLAIVRPHRQPPPSRDEIESHSTS